MIQNAGSGRSAPPGMDEVATATFRATSEADEAAQLLKDRLGFGAYYVPARLAIARSLSIPEKPPAASGSPGRAIKGENLFGKGEELATWLSLFVEYEQRPIRDIADLQNRVRDHWVRGMDLLERLMNESEGDDSRFWRSLAATCLPASIREVGAGTAAPVATAVPKSLVIPLGFVSRDTAGSPVDWLPVGGGGSPHGAIMGGVGSGKTRNAVFMLKKLREQSEVPLIAFDFKGDMTDASNLLDRAFDARVVAPPEVPVPLDVLALSSRSETDIKLASQRLRDTLATLKGGGFGPTQKGLLADAAERALRDHDPCRLDDVRRALHAVYDAQGRSPDGASTTMDDLCRFDLFSPYLGPDQFFTKSWIVRLSQKLPELVRVAVVTLITDALDRWLNSQPDAPVDVHGNRALRVVALLDEAHRILGTRLPGLSNLIRLSRSKGGMVWLISQSPEDFEGEDEDFLNEMGLVMAFATNAKPGATRRIFGEHAKLANLELGEAWVKLRGQPARRVRIWSP